MSEVTPRLIHALGRCVCGMTDPVLEVSDVVAVLLLAQCCGAVYLARGKFVSLLHGSRPGPAKAGTTNIEAEGGAEAP